MKRILSVLLIFVIITVLTACGPSPTPVSSAPGEESAASTSESAASVTSSTPAESSGSSSLASQPVRSSSAASVSQTTGSEATSSTPPICILYGPNMFKTNEELFDYLKTVDLREKKFDIIADEGICLIPRLVDQPKSKAGNTDYNDVLISTERGGGEYLGWRYIDAQKTVHGDVENSKTVYNVGWRTAKEFYNKPIRTGEDLKAAITSHYDKMDFDVLKVINKEDKFYVLANASLYFLYDGKYVVSVSISVDTSVDELILLAEDIVFDKHKLR